MNEETPEELSPEEAAYLEHAQGVLHRDGDLEFDENAKVSISEDGGAYVQCWKWIDRSVLNEMIGPVNDDEEE